MVAEISEIMSEVESENYVRHHNWDPLNAHKTFEEVGKYFPGDRIPNINVSYISRPSSRSSIVGWRRI